MPSTDEHLNAAKLYLNGYAGITDDSMIPVRAALLFYSAMHLIEAVAAKDNKHHGIHSARVTFIQQSHRKIAHAYRQLSQIGSDGRYHPSRLQNLNAIYLQSTHYTRHYKKIAYWMAEQLGDQSFLEDFLLSPAATAS